MAPSLGSSLAVPAALLLLVACPAVATPVSKGASKKNANANAFAVKSFHATPRKWKQVGDAPAQHLLNLQFGLKQAKMDEMLRHLDEVSDPTHDRYGQHLTADEVNRLVRPSDQTLEIVSSWLVDSGIRPEHLSLNPAKDWISVYVPVEKANDLLNTRYSVFEHVGSGAQLIRTPEWSLPAFLHDHIDVVEPTNSFLRPVKKTPKSTVRFGSFISGEHESVSRVNKLEVSNAGAASNGTGPTECDINLVTPGCLRTLYGTLGYVPKAVDKNRMSISNYLGELTIRADLKTYLENFRPEAVGAETQFPQFSIDNGTTSQTIGPAQLAQQTGVEGALDIQSMIGIAWPTNMISYSTGGVQPGFKPDNFTKTNSNEPYLAWVQYMLNLNDSQIPYVVSTSYADDEQTVSPEYAKRVCESFAQLGARGVSLFFGSGDEGVGSNGDCFSNSPPYGRTFLPEFPSTCPYITAVGATYKFNPEVAALDARFATPFTSGGGFSDLFPAPAYQKAAVDAYVAANNGFPAYSGWFNASGRAFPDVAAQGVNFSVVWNNRVIAVDGTSASSPAFAGIIALVNDALLAAGRSPMGFLNPWLYQGGYKAFTDVTSGSSAGCETAGFPAAPGWDAVTGWGTPSFPKILENLGLGTATPPKPNLIEAPTPLAAQATGTGGSTSKGAASPEPALSGPSSPPPPPPPEATCNIVPQPVPAAPAPPQPVTAPRLVPKSAPNSPPAAIQPLDALAPAPISAQPSFMPAPQPAPVPGILDPAAGIPSIFIPQILPQPAMEQAQPNLGSYPEPYPLPALSNDPFATPPTEPIGWVGPVAAQGPPPSPPSSGQFGNGADTPFTVAPPSYGSNSPFAIPLGNQAQPYAWGRDDNDDDEDSRRVA